MNEKAREILRKFFPPPKNEGEKNDDLNIIKMMQEYAEWYHQEVQKTKPCFFIRNIETGNIHRVFKMIDNLRDNEIHVWCEDWYGHHIIGKDCEWYHSHHSAEVSEMETKYSKEEFEGYTHRFIVRFKIDDDWRNDTRIDIYSNSDSYQNLENFINSKKTDKVKSFTIEHRASKEQDEMSAKFIDEVLNSRKPN